MKLHSQHVIYQLAHWLHQLLLHNLEQASKQQSSTPLEILSTGKDKDKTRQDKLCLQALNGMKNTRMFF